MLRGSRGRSLRTLAEADRLSAAWTVACGRAMAERGEIMGFVDGVLEVEVADAQWLEQMEAMHGQLAGEVGRIAGVAVREIHFRRRGAAGARQRRTMSPMPSKD